MPAKAGGGVMWMKPPKPPVMPPPMPVHAYLEMVRGLPSVPPLKDEHSRGESAESAVWQQRWRKAVRVHIFGCDK